MIPSLGIFKGTQQHKLKRDGSINSTATSGETTSGPLAALAQASISSWSNRRRNLYPHPDTNHTLNHKLPSARHDNLAKPTHISCSAATSKQEKADNYHLGHTRNTIIKRHSMQLLCVCMCVVCTLSQDERGLCSRAAAATESHFPVCGEKKVTQVRFINLEKMKKKKKKGGR